MAGGMADWDPKIDNTAVTMPTHLVGKRFVAVPNSVSVTKRDDDGELAEALKRAGSTLGTGSQVKFWTLERPFNKFRIERDDVIDVPGLNARVRPVQRLTFDDWKPLTDACTDFVTHHFMSIDNVAQQFKLVATINARFTQAISDFCKNRTRMKPKYFKFVYKGGNVMRFLLHAFKTQQPIEVVGAVERVYGDYFKASDMDFQVVLEGEGAKVVDTNDVHALAEHLFECMKGLRTEWAQGGSGGDEPDEVFPFLQRSADAQQAEVDALSSKMGEIGKELAFPITVKRASLLGIVSPPTQPPAAQLLARQAGRCDMKIEFMNELFGDRSTRLVCEDVAQGQRATYCSLNETLSIPRTIKGIDSFAHFDLVRMKLAVSVECKCFESSFTKRLGGEMVDVSISHPDQKSLKLVPPTFVTLRRKSCDMYVRYTLEQHGQGDTKVEGYTLPHLIYDLLIVLFYDNTFPFDDAKYTKRVNRIGGLLLCNLLTEEGVDIDSKISTMREMKLGKFRTRNAGSSAQKPNAECAVRTLHGHLREKVGCENACEIGFTELNPPTIYAFVKDHFEPYVDLVQYSDVYHLLKTYNDNIDRNIEILEKMQRKAYRPYTLRAPKPK